MNERFWAEPVREGGEVAARAERNARNLPNNWDDFRVASREDRSWKRHRRTRWKTCQR
ncbi:hypothetical protein [Azoarcus sp. CIB]|uniref:hypothetical protein n=1 Tax=Aromatoleum sp. (strain CIB) TaxID=198107 RepID=UPI0012ED4B15|nr:hypothetical protein [Azoarcus sp. CIB]